MASKDPLKKVRNRLLLGDKHKSFLLTDSHMVKYDPHNKMQHKVRKQKQSFVYHNL